jgi:hypothetical protein
MFLRTTYIKLSLISITKSILLKIVYTLLVNTLL